MFPCILFPHSFAGNRQSRIQISEKMRNGTGRGGGGGTRGAQNNERFGSVTFAMELKQSEIGKGKRDRPSRTRARQKTASKTAGKNDYTLRSPFFFAIFCRTCYTRYRRAFGCIRVYPRCFRFVTSAFLHRGIIFFFYFRAFLASLPPRPSPRSAMTDD